MLGRRGMLILKPQREANPAEGTVTLENWLQLPTVGLYLRQLVSNY